MGPTTTASGADWMTVWGKLRDSEGIQMPEFSLFPAYVDNQWLDQSCTVGSANSVLLDILDIAGVKSSTRYSSHSFKATLLSYSASFGLPLPERKILGYHSVAADKSVLKVLFQRPPTRACFKVFQHAY